MTVRPKSATQRAVEEKVFSLARGMTVESDDDSDNGESVACIINTLISHLPVICKTSHIYRIYCTWIYIYTLQVTRWQFQCKGLLTPERCFKKVHLSFLKNFF